MTASTNSRVNQRLLERKNWLRGG
eukprot:SAG11_NODE_22907_length_398_cov_0.879599_1_plen_23_part_10